MEKILLEFLKKENITSISDIKKATYGDLSCIDVFYVKDKEFYIARSYTNGVWLSNVPVGPKEDENGYIMDTLFDVATIIKCNTAKEWKTSLIRTEQHLEDVLRLFDRKTRDMAELYFDKYAKFLYSTNFSFTPRMNISAVVRDKDKLLGMINIEPHRCVTVLAKYDAIIDDIVDIIKSNMHE